MSTLGSVSNSKSASFHVIIPIFLNSIDSLPVMLRFLATDDSPLDWNVHRTALLRRYIHIRSLLYRPFLYLIAHWRDYLEPESLSSVSAMAYKAVSNCLLASDSEAIWYRDDDSWYTCRLAVANMLTLEVAHRAGLLATDQLHRIDRTVEDIAWSMRSNRAAMERFAQDAPDLRTLKDIIESLITLHRLDNAS